MISGAVRESGVDEESDTRNVKATNKVIDIYFISQIVRLDEGKQQRAGTVPA